MTTSPASNAPLIQLKDIHKSFGQHHVLSGISMDIHSGDAVCLIGPSGSGKSTLLRCINGLVVPDQGSVKVGPYDVMNITTEKERIALRKYVSIVFQQYNLYPHKTVLENVMLAPVHVLKQDKAEVEARARILLDKVRLKGKESHYPGELSGGQQQRVAIARALAMRPNVLLFDEVTAALDPETVKEVLSTIRELVSDGITSILVTHEMGFAKEVANHVFFTDKGVIVEHGHPRDLFTSPQHARTQAFLSQVL